MSELEALKKEINERIDKLIESQKSAPLKPNFEVGKWYFGENKASGHTWIAKFSSLTDYFVSSEMYPLSGNWANWGISNESSLDLMTRLATKEEIQSALEAEAKRRGFKEGVMFRNILSSNNDYNTITAKGNLNIYKPEDDQLWFSVIGCIYNKGQWAKIITKEKIKIGGYEVFFNDTSQIGETWYSTVIADYGFTKQFWQAAKTISEHSKAKIMIGCSKQFDVSLETINKIIERLK